MNNIYKVTFKNIPYYTKCSIQKKNQKYKSGFLYIDGTKIFECDIGDIIKFKHNLYEDLNLKVLVTDHKKIFDMDEEFELYDSTKHSFVANFFRRIRK